MPASRRAFQPAVSTQPRGGTALAAVRQVYSSVPAPVLALDCAITAGAVVLPAGTPIYLSLTTAQGAAVTAGLYI